MKFDPPMLTEGPLSGNVYVVTHGKTYPHPKIEGETIIEASVKYDVTDQFKGLASKRERDAPTQKHRQTMERLAETAFALQRVRYDYQQLRDASLGLLAAVGWLTLRKAQRPGVDAAVAEVWRVLTGDKPTEGS